MYRINSLASEPKQRVTMLVGNMRIKLTFVYKANQLGWFFDFEYNGTTYQNIRLTTSYNILRAYKSWLPFGISCTTLDGLEPMDISDFSSGYAKVYILTKSEIDTIEGIYYAKTTPNI